MDKINSNKFSKKSVVDSKHLSGLFDDKARCNDRVVRSEPAQPWHQGDNGPFRGW